MEVGEEAQIQRRHCWGLEQWAENVRDGKKVIKKYMV